MDNSEQGVVTSEILCSPTQSVGQIPVTGSCCTLGLVSLACENSVTRSIDLIQSDLVDPSSLVGWSRFESVEPVTASGDRMGVQHWPAAPEGQPPEQTASRQKPVR